MSGWRLRLREPTTLPLDLTPLLPERVVGIAERELAALTLRHGNRAVPAGDLFAIGTEGEDGTLVLEGTTSACDGIGAGMGSGSLRVEGDAGVQLARSMRGGWVLVTGRVGAYLASGMVDGVVQVAGDAGDHAAAALPGEMAGMRGGIVAIGGAAGDRLGDRMRRGVVTVRGDAGNHAASRMIGGTIVVAGTAGPAPGYGMRRGSLLVGTAPPRTLPTFAETGSASPVWLALLQRHLVDTGAGWPGPGLALARWRRLVGCASTGGRGEILLGEGGGVRR